MIGRCQPTGSRGYPSMTEDGRRMAEGGERTTEENEGKEGRKMIWSQRARSGRRTRRAEVRNGIGTTEPGRAVTGRSRVMVPSARPMPGAGLVGPFPNRLRMLRLFSFQRRFPVQTAGNPHLCTMRKLILGSAFLALAFVAIPASAQTATASRSSLDQMVATVTKDPVSLETMVTAAVATNPAAARDIVAAMTKAFPTKASKIAESAVAALAVNLPAGDLSLAVSGVLESMALTLADGRFTKLQLNNAITECVAAAESALTTAGLSAEFAQQTIVAASANLANRLPLMDAGTALAAPVGDFGSTHR